MLKQRVTLRPSGRAFECGDDASVLDAALKQGVALPYSCRTGTCGACRARVIDGRVHYPHAQPLGLTAEERDEGYALLCQAHAASALVLEVRELDAVAQLKIKTLPARVARMERLSHDVMGLWLKLPAVERLQFLAGQYVDVLLAGGERRSFSIANAPHEDDFIELHVRHVPGGSFTTRVFEEIHERSLLRIQGPLGTFFLREDSTRPILMLAGGTGFAPMKGILSHAFAANVARPIRLYWGVRAARDLYMRAQCERWRAERASFGWTPVLSHPDEDWTGRTGLVHEALLADHPRLADHDVYMAGPPPMIEAARAAFHRAGLPDDQLFYDSFEYQKKL
jgi:CDP-4-dehydro-6-deoxyglucose reductase